VPRAAARRFNLIAWPAFAVLVITGIWNLMEVHVGDASSAYQVTLMIKITLAILSGVFVAVHSVGTSKLALALGGALGALTALGALFLGIVLKTGT
jgi:hypothetical protein